MQLKLRRFIPIPAVWDRPPPLMFSFRHPRLCHITINLPKRVLDIVLSGIAILILSPLLIPIMIALKCTGEHDIFYGQTRIGRGKYVITTDGAPVIS